VLTGPSNNEVAIPSVRREASIYVRHFGKINSGRDRRSAILKDSIVLRA
jgi:hypothetical protein